MKSIISLLLFAKQTLGSGSAWDYDHMSAWSNEFSMCAALDQSPIDIQPLEAVIDPSICTANFDWDVDFTKQNFLVKNNGHSITLRPVQSISTEEDVTGLATDSDGNQWLPLSLNENTIATFTNNFAIGDKHQKYCLDSLHFHWGTSDETGSEHLINGQQYPLEVHFVHYSCDHSSLGSTLSYFPTKESVETASEYGDDVHTLGVIGIMFDVVDDRINPAFEAIFANETLHSVDMPTEAGAAAEIVEGLDLSQMIPDHLLTEGYYAYKGSLTTPPCTNIVNWHVMNARSYIGTEQMEQFRQLMSTETYPIAPNFREVQDRHNTVYSCVSVVEVENIVERIESVNVAMIAVIITLTLAIIIGIVVFCMYKKRNDRLIEEIKGRNSRARIHTESTQIQQYGSDTASPDVHV